MKSNADTLLPSNVRSVFLFSHVFFQIFVDFFFFLKSWYEIKCQLKDEMWNKSVFFILHECEQFNEIWTCLHLYWTYHWRGSKRGIREPPPPTPAYSSVQFLSFSCVFWQKFCCQIIGFCPKLRDWRPLPVCEIMDPPLRCYSFQLMLHLFCIKSLQLS